MLLSQFLLTFHQTIYGSFHVTSPNPSHLKLMDFVEILSCECIIQEMKILFYENLKILPFSGFDLTGRDLWFMTSF